MATIVVRKHGKGTRYQVKVRLRGFPCKTETFVRKSDATRWASATETHLREARHFPGDGPPERTLCEIPTRGTSARSQECQEPPPAARLVAFTAG